MFYQRTINASRSHVDSALLSTGPSGINGHVVELSKIESSYKSHAYMSDDCRSRDHKPYLSSHVITNHVICLPKINLVKTFILPSRKLYKHEFFPKILEIILSNNNNKLKEL